MSHHLLKEFIRNHVFILREEKIKTASEKKKEEEDNPLGFNIDAFDLKTKDGEDILSNLETDETDPVNKDTPQSKLLLKTIESNPLISQRLKGLKRSQDLKPVLAKLVDKTSVNSSDTQRTLRAVGTHEREEKEQGENLRDKRSLSSTKGTKSTY